MIKKKKLSINFMSVAMKRCIGLSLDFSEVIYVPGNASFYQDKLAFN